MDHPDNDPNPLYLEFNFDSNYELHFQPREFATSSNGNLGLQLPYLNAKSQNIYRPIHDAYNTQQYGQTQPLHVQQYGDGYQQPPEQFVAQQHEYGENLNQNLENIHGATSSYTIQMCHNISDIRTETIGDKVTSCVGDSLKQETAEAAVIERIIVSTPRMVKQPVVVSRCAAASRSIGQQTREFRRKEPHRSFIKLYDDDYTFVDDCEEQIQDVIQEDISMVQNSEGNATKTGAPIAKVESPFLTDVPMDLTKENSTAQSVTKRKETSVNMNWTPVRPSKRLLEKNLLTKSKKRLLTTLDIHENDV